MLPKHIHEIRDPIHVFIRMNTDERRVVDSRYFQRLRHIHQLALSYLVYPGATHKRFEHALGTMELATKVYDVVTDPQNAHERIRSLVPEISSPPESLGYWRQVLRMAALCHDIGHLPFSHAAEKDLLPEGWNHERLTVEIIKSAEMREIWEKMTPPLRAEDIAKIAVGQKILTEETFSVWETILSEIIVGDAFGVDRIDYLLRDSLHVGVAYGRFDHHRLLDTLRILPGYEEDKMHDPASEPTKPAIGIERGGIHSAQALLLARYFMYSQVYLHPIRRIYDKHLIDFLKCWLPQGKFPTASDELMRYTDVEILQAIFEAARASDKPGHDAAMRIVERKHFKNVYSRTRADLDKRLEPGRVIYKGLCDKYGADAVYHDRYEEKARENAIQALERDGRIVPELEMLSNIPLVTLDNVFVAPEYATEASEWINSNRDKLLAEAQQEEGDT